MYCTSPVTGNLPYSHIRNGGGGAAAAAIEKEGRREIQNLRGPKMESPAAPAVNSLDCTKAHCNDPHNEEYG